MVRICFGDGVGLIWNYVFVMKLIVRVIWLFRIVVDLLVDWVVGFFFFK